ncbi:predicted protein [Sclerotinia sclerotiorum 1980 UF-70]|uniref:Uncharacterized protein n=1 Tax=Sclerotinia sclerotiorum (strain ATCC 18683 / 1980 / Ss-1) TaxID=665079 RepID=A7E448_SCLS1|nr:predicted protein [Sclerotinia sclerotiorum 1980 UF-70]EDN90670.1 predicted protein [Sclerotinia sclerotiorum 1980 UF-70]
MSSNEFFFEKICCTSTYLRSRKLISHLARRAVRCEMIGRLSRRRRWIFLHSILKTSTKELNTDNASKSIFGPEDCEDASGMFLVDDDYILQFTMQNDPKRYACATFRELGT